MDEHPRLSPAPEARRSALRIRWPSIVAPAPVDLQAAFERERSALTDYWRRLCEEMEAVDRRLDELDVLLGAS